MFEQWPQWPRWNVTNVQFIFFISFFFSEPLQVIIPRMCFHVGCCWLPFEGHHQKMELLQSGPTRVPLISVSRLFPFLVFTGHFSSRWHPTNLHNCRASPPHRLSFMSYSAPVALMGTCRDAWTYNWSICKCFFFLFFSLKKTRLGLRVDGDNHTDAWCKRVWHEMTVIASAALLGP